MRLVVAKEHVRLAVRWTRYTLFSVGVTMLAYCGFVVMDAWLFQKGESRRLDRLLTDGKEAAVGARQAASMASPKQSPPDAIDGLIGRLEIPRLGLSTIVVEGASKTTLRRAVGHISGTALPGQPGNIGISGHRDTFFRPLRNIEQHDIILFTTVLGEYRYRVVSTRIVRPNDIAVLNPSGDEVLTLVTCYPFYFVGSAPDRFVVRAERVI